MAGESLEPGMGGNSKLEKRIATIERFIGRFKVVNIFAKNQFGKNRKYEILAKEGRFKDDEGGGIYDVTLIAQDSKYFVTVTHGWVREMRTGSGDALGYHEADNHFEETDPKTDPKTFTEKLAEFPIEVGQAAYITAQVAGSGRIYAGESEKETKPVSIEIAEDNKESVQYQPKVDDETSGGVAGVLRFKLAVLEAPEKEGDRPKLKDYLSGDHIHYAPPLPSILSTLLGGEGIGLITQKWDNFANAVKLRVLRQKTPVAAVEPEGENPGSPAQAVQIRVKQEPNAILIHGNGKIHTVNKRFGDGSEEPLIAIDDGLETLGKVEGKKTVLLIPETQVIRGLTIKNKAVNGGIIYEIGLPEAEEGDTLYFDGKNWILLKNPSAPESGFKWVMHHSGVAPFWESYEERTIQICVEGVGPMPFKILAKPIV